MESEYFFFSGRRVVHLFREIPLLYGAAAPMDGILHFVSEKSHRHVIPPVSSQHSFPQKHHKEIYFCRISFSAKRLQLRRKASTTPTQSIYNSDAKHLLFRRKSVYNSDAKRLQLRQQSVYNSDEKASTTPTQSIYNSDTLVRKKYVFKPFSMISLEFYFRFYLIQNMNFIRFKK